MDKSIMVIVCCKYSFIKKKLSKKCEYSECNETVMIVNVMKLVKQ